MVGCDLGISVGDPIDGRLAPEDVDSPAPEQGGGGDAGGSDAGNTGTFEPFTIGARGLNTTSSYELIIGATAATSPVGCTLFSSEKANPGQATSLVYAKFKAESGSYCPEGSYAINGEQGYCSQLLLGALPYGCAVYKSWDASGTQVSNLFAIGGGATVTNTSLGNGDQLCVVEIQLLFPGGASWSDAYQVGYYYAAPGPSCVE